MNYRPGVKPNPKKDKEARRKRPAVPPYPIYRTVVKEVEVEVDGQKVLKKRKVLDEVEPVEVPVYINTNTITDAFVWTHNLPKEQK